MTSTFFSGRDRDGHTSPNLDPTPVGVDAKPPKGHRVVMPMAENLRLLRAAAVLEQEIRFLGDSTHVTEPPDRDALMGALAIARDYLRDGVVVG